LRPAGKTSKKASSVKAERRPMTALFCDIVDSVGLSVRVDPEELMRIFDLYRTACNEVVTEHGGFLARFVGDGMLAYFGYPQADEHAAANAVRAGIALVDRIRLLDAALDPPLRGRVGIATGLVVVSGLASPGIAGSAEIVGKMPNLAARLQSLAAPGRVVISKATRNVTRGLFTYRDMGAKPLKGYTRPVQAWEVVRENAVSRFHARLEEAASSFVGRQRERDLLAHKWTQARAGTGQVVQIMGEPGIGKSRLAEAMEEHIAGEPHVRTRWFCSSQHVDSAFYAVRQQLERAASIKRNDPASVKLDKLARVAGAPDPTTLEVLAALLAIPLDRPLSIDALTPQKRKELTMAALLALFRQLCGTVPVLMVVEDAHWIDATSLELLQLIVQRADQDRVLLLITARPEFKPRWTDLPFVSTMNVERLDPASAAELCAHVAADSLSPELLRQVVARCDGIPLFAEELTKTVVESLIGTDDETSDSAATIPYSLHDSLVARLDRLGTARHIANVGAVIGRRFNYDLLVAVLSRPESELRTALRRLTRSGLVNQSGTPPASSYLFKHALIRDAAYDSLLRADRQKLHGQIAAVLLSHFPDLPESEPEVMAYHLSESGATAKAVPYWGKAGQRAASRAAHVEAAGHYGAAVEGVRKQADSAERAQQELSLLVPLAISLSSSRGYGAVEVGHALTEARNLCERLGNVAGLFPVLRGLCSFSIVTSDIPTAEELARRCLQIGQQTGHVPYLIEGHTELGWVLFARGELRQATFHLEHSLSLYAEHQESGFAFPTEQDPRVACGGLLALALDLQGDPSGGDQASRDALAWARSLRRPFDLAFALSFASIHAAMRGNYLETKLLAEEMIVPSERFGFPIWLLSARLMLAAALGNLGHYDDAIALLKPTLAAWNRVGVKSWTCLHMGNLAQFLCAAGSPDDALATLDAAIRHAHVYHDLFYLSRLHRIRADILGKSPAPDLVLITAELRRAISIARSQGAAMLEAEAMTRLEELLPQLARAGN
jgi:class 3 adenylate cyclase/tetratricopeptide (TPR) repeat protein